MSVCPSESLSTACTLPYTVMLGAHPLPGRQVMPSPFVVSAHPGNGQFIPIYEVSHDVRSEVPCYDNVTHPVDLDSDMVAVPRHRADLALLLNEPENTGHVCYVYSMDMKTFFGLAYIPNNDEFYANCTRPLTRAEWVRYVRTGLVRMAEHALRDGFSDMVFRVLDSMQAQPLPKQA